MKKIRVVQWGLGAMGSGMARLMLEKTGLKLVGAIDQRPDYLGKDLGDVLGTGKKLGVKGAKVHTVDATGIALDEVVPVPSLPAALDPHATSVPSAHSAKLWLLPAATATTVFPASTPAV